MRLGHAGATAEPVYYSDNGENGCRAVTGVRRNMPAGKKRVLIADSEAWSVQLFVDASEHFGVEIHSAKNGIDAIEKFKTLTPDLVVVDTLLPKLDGLQVAAKISQMELGRITPIVVSSAIYQAGPDVERLRQTYGFTDFLEKPFKAEEVRRLFTEYLAEEAEAVAADREVEEDGAPMEVLEITQIALSEMGIPALLQQLHRTRKTGILTLRNNEITKVLFFQDGNLTHARSNSRRDRLGRMLLRAKRITLDDYDHARRVQFESSGYMQLGSALVQIGVLNENDVVNVVSSQILSVVFSLFSWRTGTWSFVETTSIASAYQRFKFNTPNIIFWGLRQLEGRLSFASYLPPAKSIIERAENADLVKESLHLTYFEEQILGLVDGKKRFGEIVAIGRLAQIDVERVMFALLVVGVIRLPADEPTDQPPESGQPVEALPLAASSGYLQQTSVARLFSRIHLAGQSARVKIRKPGAETAVWFDRGEIVYANSAAEENRLATILLRASKVTHEDHERAIKLAAQQDDKKIGAIFLEIRALSLDELHWALRFQVQKIVLELFSWQEGEFELEEIEPPGDRMLTLNATTANLIMEGVRSTAAPPGIANLLLSPNLLLMKLWSDYRITRLLQLSSSEMRLLSYVESGRSVQDVRSLGLMSDAELSRTLHGLLALEIVKAMTGTAPTPASQAAVRPTEAETMMEPGYYDDDDEVTGEINLVDLRRRLQAHARKKSSENLEEENRELRSRLEELEMLLKLQQKSKD